MSSYYHPFLMSTVPLAADSDADGNQSDSAVDDEDGASEEDNTQDLVDRTRGELGSAISDAASRTAGKLNITFRYFIK
jgi:hypothetical protein